MQLTFVNKAGWLLKRGKLQRKWVKRWFSVNSHKGSFKYCNIPGSVSLTTHAKHEEGQHLLLGKLLGTCLVMLVYLMHLLGR